MIIDSFLASALLFCANANALAASLNILFAVRSKANTLSKLTVLKAFVVM